jgi:hypothetical protein
LEGVEQNPGGTSVIQKELVYQHFKLTEELFELLLNESKFTRMSPMQRRKWIIEMSGSDLDYAMSVHQQLASRSRDMVGVVKHLNKRLTEETDKLPSHGQLDEMMARSELLKEELTLMMEEKENGLPQAFEIKERIDANISQIEELAIAILEAECVKPVYLSEREVTELSQLDKAIAQIEGERFANTKMLRHHQDEYMKIKDIVDAMEKSNAVGLEGLKTKIDELSAERSLVRGQIGTFMIDRDADKILIATDAVMSELMEIFSQLQDNRERKYTRERRDETKGFLDKALQDRDALRNRLARIEHRLEHIGKAEHEICPKCTHRWIPGVTEGDEKKLQVNVEEHQKAIKALDERISSHEHLLEEIRVYGDLYRHFNRIVEANPRLKKLWDHLAENQIPMTAPKRALAMFEQWSRDVSLSSTFERLSEQITTLDAAYQHGSSLNGDKHYSVRIQELNDGISTCMDLEQEYKQMLAQCSSYRETCLEILHNSSTIDGLIVKVNQDTNLLVRTLKRDVLVSTIRNHQGTLALTENSLTQARAATDIVRDLKTSFTQAELDGEVFKILADELSPVDGLIADQLKGFIGALVDQMNLIISQVWTYDLRILPCGMESDELDYKFPIQVNFSDMLVPDVSKASAGQVDIVDFAFKLIAMLYLELEDFPLYLDELAPALDEAHRVAIMHFVRSLVETNKCSQMWLVSHYQQGHGIFSNAEVCVMDDSNIVNVPHSFNNHVVMR